MRGGTQTGRCASARLGFSWCLDPPMWEQRRATRARPGVCVWAGWMTRFQRVGSLMLARTRMSGASGRERALVVAGVFVRRGMRGTCVGCVRVGTTRTVRRGVSSVWMGVEGCLGLQWLGWWWLR